MQTSASRFAIKFTNEEKSYNSSNEKVTDFEQTFEMNAKGADFMGFSYKTSKDGEKETTNYIINSTTKGGVYMYRRFTNKEEYEKTLERIKKFQETNKNKDEK